MRVLKYGSPLATLLDVISYSMTYPFLFCTSSLFCCYLTNSAERGKYATKAIHYLLVGPALVSLTMVTLPPYLVGQVLWILLCHWPGLDKTDFARIDLERDSSGDVKNDGRFTFISANVLLGLDFLGKFQNMSFVYHRLWMYWQILSRFGRDHLTNLSELNNSDSRQGKEISISPELPAADFLLFQEVWDRFFIGALIWKLRSRFKHFVVDISKQSLGWNYCTGSSGLFVASRYPILEVEYYPFDNKKQNWQAFISYGMIMVKVDLGKSSDNNLRKVGYFANLHCMAYQEKHDQISVALTNAMRAFDKFRNKSADQETTVFATIGGDFNCDNLSPGDMDVARHKLFSTYKDVCMEEPGKDKPWTIGTELRQMKVHDDLISTPKKFKAVLQDDVMRRYYVIDANIEVQTMDLMYCEPTPDSEGRITAIPWGGCRRIDKLIYDPNCQSVPIGCRFLSCFAGGMTDHIPFALTLEEQTKDQND